MPRLIRQSTGSSLDRLRLSVWTKSRPSCHNCNGLNPTKHPLYGLFSGCFANYPVTKMNIQKIAIGLCLIFALTACGQVSRADQCRSLMRVSGSKLSEQPTFKDFLESNKAYLKQYQSIALSDDDLKQHRNKLVDYYKQAIELSQAVVDLGPAFDNNSLTDEQKLRVRNYAVNVVVKLPPLINKSIELCRPNPPKS